jgi:hypothetical protein
MNKVAFVDLQCPLGHIYLIDFFIDKFKKNFDYIILNKKIEKYLSNKNINFILYKDNIFLRLFSLLKICNYLVSKDIKKILFFSYDIKFFFFISFFLKLRKIQVILVEHDTLNPRTKFYFLLNKLISGSVTRLVYTKEQFYFVKKYLSQQVRIIDLPILKDNNKFNKVYPINNKFNFNSFKKKILIPSRFNLDFKLLYDFINNHKNIQFFVLSKKIDILDNVIFIENVRDNIIKKIDAVYLPINNKIYRYRVTSWLYKAIAYNKKIILDHGFTYNFEKKRFGNLIANSSQDIDIFLTKKIYIRQNFIRDYNLRLISNIKKILND